MKVHEPPREPFFRDSPTIGHHVSSVVALRFYLIVSTVALLVVGFGVYTTIASVEHNSQVQRQAHASRLADEATLRRQFAEALVQTKAEADAKITEAICVFVRSYPAHVSPGLDALATRYHCPLPKPKPTPSRSRPSGSPSSGGHASSTPRPTPHASRHPSAPKSTPGHPRTPTPPAFPTSLQGLLCLLIPFAFLNCH